MSKSMTLLMVALLAVSVDSGSDTAVAGELEISPIIERVKAGQKALDRTEDCCPTEEKGEEEALAPGDLIGVETHPDGSVTLWENEGREMVARERYAKDLFDDDFPNSYVLFTMYKEDNLGGSSYTFWRSNSNLTGWSNLPSTWNDQMDSYVMKGGCTITWYRDADRGGGSIGSVDRTGKTSAWVPHSSAEAASSYNMTCANNTDANGFLFQHGSYGGHRLPVWESWTLDASDPDWGTWPSQVSSFDINKATGNGLSFVSTASNTDGEQFWAYDDLDLLPGELNDHVKSFVGRVAPPPKRCSPRKTCWWANAHCSGTYRGAVNSARECANLNGQSYCDDLGYCKNPRTGAKIID